jgi:hypothetical protein
VEKLDPLPTLLTGLLEAQRGALPRVIGADVALEMLASLPPRCIADSLDCDGVRGIRAPRPPLSCGGGAKACTPWKRLATGI